VRKTILMTMMAMLMASSGMGKLRWGGCQV